MTSFDKWAFQKRFWIFSRFEVALVAISGWIELTTVSGFFILAIVFASSLLKTATGGEA